MTNSLRIYTLGGLRIASNGNDLDGFVSQKTQILFVYLAMLRAAQPRKGLARMFYPFSESQQGATNLRVALHSLRKQLPTYVSATRSEIGINAGSAIWLDIESLEEDLSSAKAQALDKRGFSRVTVELIEKALTLYKGDFLEGYAFDNAETVNSIDSWIDSERKWLRALVFEALDYLLEFCLSDSDYATGIAQAARLIRLDPPREKSHYEMMILLAQTGQIDEALNQYQVCLHYLAEKGLKPSSELTNLYERLRDRGEIGALAQLHWGEFDGTE